MKKSTIALFFALALAVLAVIMVRKWIVQKTEELDKGKKTVSVLIADEIIKPGDRLAENQVKGFKIDESTLLPEMILESDRRNYIGKTVIKEVRRGNALLVQYFREESVERVVTITQGSRIATINVSPVTGISGLVSPGDHVDVLVTFRGGAKADSQAGPSARTMTVFHDVMVFAIDDVTRVAYKAARSRSSMESSYSTVTLLLYPHEVELLVYAQACGEITLSKRSSSDAASPKLTGVDTSTFSSLVDEAQRRRGGN